MVTPREELGGIHITGSAMLAAGVNTSREGEREVSITNRMWWLWQKQDHKNVVSDICCWSHVLFTMRPGQLLYMKPVFRLC